MRRFFLMGAILMAFARIAAAREIEFVEDFALTADRAVALRQLIPGTEDFYYYHSLHFLNTEQFDKVAELQAPWVQRHGETQRVWEIRTRSALLTYDKNPAATLEYLRRRFNIHFPHQKEELNAEPNFPTALDAALISRQQFIDRANSNPNSLDGYEDSALDWLTKSNLNANQRRSLLSRLTRPDYDTLPKLVLEDLAYQNSGGFGSLGIHRQLLLSQLEALLKAQPNLLNQQQFVVTYLTKLQPGADENWRQDPALLEAWLERLEAFAARLNAAHNSLKAHVLYHRLVLDRQRGIFNKARFLAYLQLPRHVHYASKAVIESAAYREFPSDLNANYEGATLLSPIGNDEPLVRSYLHQFFLEATTTKEFEPFINDVYLRHLFAETKIVNGLGDPEQWASLLPPELYQQLKQRVDIDFAFTNQTQFASAAPVSLDLDVKNVSTLIVKVFEINTKNYYRDQRREVDTDINLDGLVPNFEQTFNYTEPPLRRVRRHFDFPQLNKAGVYIVDFIGNGRSSRGLIRKGRLRHLVRTTPAGQAFTILDENNQQVKNASLWLAGHDYPAGDNGQILVPFSANPGRQPIVISMPLPQERVAGAAKPPASFSVLEYFQQEAENYGVTAGFYVDREALLKRRTAEVIVRPGLLLNGTLVSLKLLEDVKLTIASVDLDGTPSSQEVADFPVFEDRESVHEFLVPQRLASLTFTLTATVKKLSAGGQKVTFAAADTFTLNDIDKTEKVEDLFLLKTAAGYFVELRGKTGEPRASRPVVFNFKHRDFRAPVGAVLKTNPAGRISLGDLRDISSLSVTGPEATTHTWNLLEDRHTYSQLLHGRAGEPLSLPFLPRVATAKANLREELSLLELHGEVDVTDRFEHLRVEDGLVILEKLPPGDYDLLLKSSGARIRVRMTAGEQIGRYVVGTKRQLETKPIPALQIASATVVNGQDADKKPSEMLRVSLKNVSKLTRLHVFATRYVPEYDPFGRLGRIRDAEPYLFQQTPAQSVYLTGRNIGDEYRYIIDRKYATKYPGNMLERPSLLLNPWAVRETETGEQLAAGGDDFGAAGNMPKSEAAAPPARSLEVQSAAGSFASDFDFLADATAVLVNLVPDETGIIEFSRAALGTHQQIHLVAVDPLHTTYRSVALPEVKPTFLDQRLLLAFDPKLHFTQQRQISIVPKGQVFKLQDVTTSKFETFDSLARVYGLYSTLSNDPKLVEFAFILNWPKLKPEEKRALYSKHASHELSFFLSKKDPEFFQSAIKPYLANKKDKTFVDRFLLDEDLSGYLKLWQYEQLNIMERCLLAQRIQEEKSRTVRHLADLLAVLPPNIENFNRLFGTAVLRSSLEVSDPLGVRMVITNGTAEPRMELRDRFDALAPAAETPPPPVPMSAPAGMAAAGKAGEMKELAKAKAHMKLRSGLARRGASDKKMAEKEAQGMKSGEEDKAEVLFEDLAERRKEIRQLYRKLDKTWEWAENNYHHLTIDQQTGALVSINAFWNDYAKHEAGQPFLSRNLAEAARNFPEMLFALAVLDLPFESPKHESKFDGNAMTLTSGGPIVVFHEEIKPAAAPNVAGDGAAKVLVSQNFFRHGDRQRVENGETVDKFVSEEFLTHVVYGCQVVITNPTSTRQKLNVLTQIPRGSIAVLNGQPTKTQHLDLEPYHTQTLEFYFYFPAVGQFTHFPVHVARNETLISAAAPLSFNVVDRPTKLDTESWDYVSQYGTAEEVLTYLDKHNLQELNLDKIAWRMHDAKVFEAVTAKLALRHVYQHTLWSYALLHNVVPAGREFLQHVDAVIADCGGRLNSPLLTIDPVARRTFEFLEYKPLVNARVHSLGSRRQLVNDRLHGQYHRFLKELAYAPRLSTDDLLGVTYYLLLQDRVEESLAMFKQVKAESVATNLQYDYCAAYLSFFTGDYGQARTIAQKHANSPVDRWKNTFATIVAQLDEAEGAASKTIDGEDRNQQQAALAATEPNFDFTVDAQQINLNYQNLTTVRVNFYEMDVELLFSRNPFVQQFSGQFGSIRPNHSVEVTLPKDKPTTTVALPAALRNRNVLVEITAGGQTKSQAFYSHSLLVQVIENYGQVKVTQQQTGKPVSKAYVKVYAQLSDGQVKFYKDGYTDLRGRFDYASLNTNELESAAKFSILILSDDHGALVREATPPKR